MHVNMSETVSSKMYTFMVTVKGVLLLDYVKYGSFVKGFLCKC